VSTVIAVNAANAAMSDELMTERCKTMRRMWRWKRNRRYREVRLLPSESPKFFSALNNVVGF
jgi:hypothetical protein